MQLTKALFGILIVTGCLFIPCLQRSIFASDNNELCTVESSPKVYLKGRLSNPTTRSIFQPIEVYQEENTLNIYYLCELGKIEITLCNDQGSVVYNEMLSASIRINSLINLEDFDKGDYVIKFKNDLGEELYGTLRIE